MLDQILTELNRAEAWKVHKSTRTATKCALKRRLGLDIAITGPALRSHRP